jgi:hypothetical protein
LVSKLVKQATCHLRTFLGISAFKAKEHAGSADTASEKVIFAFWQGYCYGSRATGIFRVCFLIDKFY